MILYHGSNVEIQEIDLSLSRKFKDFGTGFYLTTILDQAIERAIAISLRDGGEPIVTSFEFDDSKLNSLNIKKFEKVSEDWAIFITNNRNRNFSNYSDELSNHDNKYDIVCGPIADDNVLGSIGLFLNDVIDSKYLVKKLRYKKLNNQYSFHTESALKLLKKNDSKVYYKTTTQETIIQFLTISLIDLLMKEENLSLETAMTTFYKTKLSKKIEDIKTGYYKESASYLYELLKEELTK